MTESSRNHAPVLEKMFQFLLWLIPAVEKFPRTQKFLLGDRTQTAALDVMEHLVEAAFSRDKLAMLNRANLQLEKLRCLFRLAFELKLMDMRRYEFATRALDEVGRMVGGWKKASHAEKTPSPV
ncbi:MAG: diversity-generating retroelement protein Avd [Nitrosomonadales bacterium]|nr:diversity-generating retroelement protein Avd [Nitrosomonadales bacterium]